MAYEETAAAHPIIRDPPDVPTRTRVPVLVTDYKGPTNLFLRYKLPDVYETADNDYFHIAAGKRPVYEVFVGMFCMVCANGDGRALRAMVTDVHRNRTGAQVTIEVHYVDSGGQEFVGIESVYAIDAEAAAEPCRAVACRMRRLRPTVESSRRDLQQLSRYGEPVYEAVFHAMTDSGAYEVDLFVRCPETQKALQRLNVADFLIQSGYAKAVTYLSDDPLIGHVARGVTRVYRARRECAQGGMPVRPLLSILPPYACDICVSGARSSPVKGKSPLDIKMTFIKTPGHFYGHDLSTTTILSKVTSIVLTCTERLRSKVTRGAHHVYRKQTWHMGARVRVEDVLESGRCRVFLIDYGNRKTVHCSNLYKTDPRLFGIDSQALRFQLAGIQPWTDWTEAAVSRFAKLTCSDTPLTARLVGITGGDEDFNEKVHVVKLFSAEYGNVAERMIREGYGRRVFDKDDLDLAAVGMGHRICKFSGTQGSSGRGDGSARCHSPAIKTVTGGVKPLKPPKEGSCVLGRVSACLSPSCFYLVFPYGQQSVDSLITESNAGPNWQEMLETLMEELQVACNWKSCEKNWVAMKGDLIAAWSDQERQWYRAQVVSVEDIDLLGLFYVDYGFCEHVPVRNVRRLDPCFMRLPLQALPARLLLTKGPKNGRWDEDSVQAFADCVRGKDILVETVDSLRGLLQVRLFFANNGLLCEVGDFLEARRSSRGKSESVP